MNKEALEHRRAFNEAMRARLRLRMSATCRMTR
jgi:hypothetical protein